MHRASITRTSDLDRLGRIAVDVISGTSGRDRLPDRTGRRRNCSMRRAIPPAAALLAVLPILLSAMPALAAYGAIAWDKESGKRGWSWNEATSQKAAEVALSECGASGCKIIMRTTGGVCAALATIDTGKFVGAAARKTKDAARLAALANCQKGKAGECTIRFSDCNK
jgi:Domain of unknown function (DUF4189)